MTVTLITKKIDIFQSYCYDEGEGLFFTQWAAVKWTCTSRVGTMGGPVSNAAASVPQEITELSWKALEGNVDYENLFQFCYFQN